MVRDFPRGGCLTSAVMIVLSLRLYVSLEHPYWIFAGALITTEGALMSVRNVAGQSTELRANVIALLGQSMAFVMGGAATFFGLVAIYPPNFQ